MAQYTISIIIPVLNEAAIIQSTLMRLPQPELEIIVVDGGSQDDTVAIARSTGIKVITVAQKNRAAQMNAGANIARADLLLFLHADTELPADFISLIVDTLKQPQVVAGAFELAIASSDRSLRWIETLVKLRSHLFSLPYGDQAIFISKKIFVSLDGFADLTIMEDFELIQRLKRQGKIAIAPHRVITSGRRWQKLGVWQTTLVNQLVIAGYYLGISPAKLSNIYRRQSKKRLDRNC